MYSKSSKLQSLITMVLVCHDWIPRGFGYLSLKTAMPAGWRCRAPWGSVLPRHRTSIKIAQRRLSTGLGLSQRDVLTPSELGSLLRSVWHDSEMQISCIATQALSLTNGLHPFQLLPWLNADQQSNSSQEPRQRRSLFIKI
jgi:hypothetical protein